MSESIDLSKYAKETVLRVEFENGDDGVVLVGVCHYPLPNSHRAISSKNNRTWNVGDSGKDLSEWSHGSSVASIKSVLMVRSVVGKPVDLSSLNKSDMLRVEISGRGRGTVVAFCGQAHYDDAPHLVLADDGGTWECRNDGTAPVRSDIPITDVIWKICEPEKIDLSDYPTGIMLKVEFNNGDSGYVLTNCRKHRVQDELRHRMMYSSDGDSWPVDDHGRIWGNADRHITRIIGQMLDPHEGEGENTVDETLAAASTDPFDDRIVDLSWARSVNQSIEQLKAGSNSSGELSFLANRLVAVIEQQCHSMSILAMRNSSRCVENAMVPASKITADEPVENKIDVKGNQYTAIRRFKEALAGFGISVVVDPRGNTDDATWTVAISRDAK